MTEVEKSLEADFHFEISESLDDFSMVAAPRDSIEKSQQSIALFYETKDSNLIAEIMRPRSEHGALLPLTFAYRLFQDNPYASKVFYKEYPFFEKEKGHLLIYCLENGVGHNSESALKRFALFLHCSTNLHSFSQITPEIWRKIISSIRTSEPNSTWHPKMNLKEHHTYAIRTFSKYLDATYPAAESYESITRTKRRPSKGRKSKANNQLLSHPPAHLKPWVTAFIEYRNYLGNKTNTSQNNSFLLFTHFLNQYPKEIVSEPRIFLSDRRNSPSLISHFTRLDAGDLNRSSIVALRFIHRFTERFIEENMMFIDEDQTATLGIPLLSPSEIEFLNIEGQKKSPRKNATSTSLNWPPFGPDTLA